jgi:hypothetical protein
MSTVATKTDDPKLSPTSTTKPKVRRVRNRETYVLDGSITTEKDFVRFALEPNVWQEVPEIVYQHLRHKFGTQSTRYVLDHSANMERPHGIGESAYKVEPKPTRIVEGLDEE